MQCITFNSLHSQRLLVEAVKCACTTFTMQPEQDASFTIKSLCYWGTWTVGGIYLLTQALTQISQEICVTLEAGLGTSVTDQRYHEILGLNDAAAQFQISLNCNHSYV